MTLLRRLGSLLVSCAFASTLLLVSTPALVAAASCQATNKTAYTVTVCITAPASGATIHGDVQTTATVSFTGASPGVQRVLFNLDGTYLLTDFSDPYTFKLPSNLWVDGAHTVSASALLRDGVTSTAATVDVNFSNGVTQPPTAPSDFTVKSTSASHPVVAASGDGPDGSVASDQVAALIAGWDPDLALYLGDIYEDGSVAEMYNWYGLTGWGDLAPITNPVVGNHEYTAGVAPGYFGYWHQPPHYYAFTASAWHVIALDSTSQFNQTSPGTAQYNWLQNQLTNNPAPCTLVYFHHPVYSVGPQGNTAALQDIWKLMVDQGVDLVLTGHDHSYQRWTPIDRNGNASPTGVTQFVVGTAGHGIQAFVRTDPKMVVGFDTSPASFGALKLTLNPSGAGYVFADTSDVAHDGGALQCSGTPADTTPPTQITDLAATAPLGGYVNLTWSASVDDVGVTGYRILRNGALLTTTWDTHFKDTEVVPGASYSYQVVALDPAGHQSSPSNVAMAMPPADGGLIFVDDFESGNLGQWNASGAFTVDTSQPFAGAYGAREVADGGAAAFVTHDFSSAQTDLYYRVRFNILSQDTVSDYLMRVRTAGNQSLIGISVSSTGKLSYRNDTPGGVNHASSVTVTGNAWHEVQMRVKVAGSSGAVSFWYDGVPVPELTNVEDLGTVGVGRLQIGDNATPRTHEVLFDDVAASVGFVDDTPPPPPDTAPPSAPGTLSATATAPDRVDLAWGAATDDVGVTGYDIYRADSSDAAEGPVLLTTVDGASTAYTDVVAPETTYDYTVRARDAADNVGPAGNTASVTTPALPTSGTFTFNVGADSYVNSSNGSSNYGTATSLRIDASPEQITYLRFDLSGMGGMATQVTLRLYAQANGSAGCSVLPVADSSWGETSITWSNAPARGSPVATCSGFSANSWVEVALPASLVTGNGPLSLAISDPSSTATRFSSREGGSAAQLMVTTTEPDGVPPSAPGTLTATAAGSSAIDLAWGAATDDVGVVAYDIYRDGGLLTSVSGGTLSHQDTGLASASTHDYHVVARDGGGNTGPPGNTASATTDTAPTSGTWTFAAAADSYVDASNATANYGTSTQLRIDASPQQISYLRFDISGVSGSVSGVTLRLYAQAKGSKGCSVLPVADSTWGETTINWNNAPARGSSAASCASFSANSWVEVSLPVGLVSGNGSLSLAISNPSSTSTRFSSREGSTPAQLVVVTSAPDGVAPSAPGTLSATAVGANAIALAWGAATDNIGVVAYDIYRDSGLLTSVGGSTLSYQDGGLAASSTHSYTVSARDSSGNVGLSSNPASATTAAAPASGTWTFSAAADSYVDASKATSNFGTATSLRIDASPQQISYLRFDLPGVVGTVSSVTVRLYALARGNAGCEVLSVADSSWGETAINWNNAPALGPTVGNCAKFSVNSWVEVTLPVSLVSGNGSLSLAISDPSNTATRFSSREGGTAAQLVVVTVSTP